MSIFRSLTDTPTDTKLVVCVTREVKTVEEGIELAKRARERGWAGTVQVEAHTICGGPPSLDRVWSIEDQHAGELHQTIMGKFPKLVPEDLDVEYVYHWYGSQYAVSVRRGARHLRKLQAWRKENPTWKGLEIEKIDNRRVDYRRWCGELSLHGPEIQLTEAEVRLLAAVDALREE